MFQLNVETGVLSSSSTINNFFNIILDTHSTHCYSKKIIERLIDWMIKQFIVQLKISWINANKILLFNIPIFIVKTFHNQSLYRPVKSTQKRFLFEFFCINIHIYKPTYIVQIGKVFNAFFSLDDVKVYHNFHFKDTLATHDSLFSTMSFSHLLLYY